MWCHMMHVTWCMSHGACHMDCRVTCIMWHHDAITWCHVMSHDVISCRFMEDHATSSLIWNYKVVYRVLQTCSELPSLCTIHRILSFTEIVCRVFHWLASQPQTREELREALENEIRSFTVDKVSWRPPVPDSSQDLPTIESLTVLVYCKQNTIWWEGLGECPLQRFRNIPERARPGYTG